MMLLSALLVVLPLCVTIHASPVVVYEEECCDICELLVDPNSEFNVKCGYYMHDLIKDKIQKDCARIKALGVDEDMAIFVSGLKELCYYKTYTEITFSCPDQDVPCDKCESIAETECGQNLNHVLLRKILKDCRMIQGWEDQAKLDAFWLNLGEICQEKGLSMEEPDCLCEDECCDICDELLETYCVSQMYPIIQDKLVKDCKNVRDQGAANLQGFWDNVAELCLYKNDTTFQTPECPPTTPCLRPNPACVGECDYCAVMADYESEFQQVCAGFFNEHYPSGLDYVIYECEYLYKYDPDQLSYFIDYVLNTCIDGTDTYFEFCRYEPPIIEPPPVTVCMDKVIDLVFLVDSSGSINGEEFQMIKTFVKATIDNFDIAMDKTRVGIINFSNGIQEVVGLADGNDKDDLKTEVQSMANSFGLTNTNLAIDAATLMLSGEGRDNAEQAVILLTDGVSTDEHLTYPAMQAFRATHPAATVIAIGVGPGTHESELRAMATGLGDTNVFNVDDFDALDSILDTLTVQVCVPVDPGNGPVMMDNDEDADPTEYQCTEVLLAAAPVHERWLDYYGVYELQENKLCEDIFVYKHTSYNWYMWRRSSNNGMSGEPMWQVRDNFCDDVQLGNLFAEMVNDLEDEDPLTDGSEIWRDEHPNPGTYAKTTCFHVMPATDP